MKKSMIVNKEINILKILLVSSILSNVYVTGVVGADIYVNPNIPAVPQLNGIPRAPQLNGIPQAPLLLGIPQAPNLGGIPPAPNLGGIPPAPLLQGIPLAPVGVNFGGNNGVINPAQQPLQQLESKLIAFNNQGNNNLKELEVILKQYSANIKKIIGFESKERIITLYDGLIKASQQAQEKFSISKDYQENSQLIDGMISDIDVKANEQAGGQMQGINLIRMKLTEEVMTEGKIQLSNFERFSTNEETIKRFNENIKSLTAMKQSFVGIDDASFTQLRNNIKSAPQVKVETNTKTEMINFFENKIQTVKRADWDDYASISISKLPMGYVISKSIEQNIIVGINQRILNILNSTDPKLETLATSLSGELPVNEKLEMIAEAKHNITTLVEQQHDNNILSTLIKYNDLINKDIEAINNNADLKTDPKKENMEISDLLLKHKMKNIEVSQMIYSDSVNRFDNESHEPKNKLTARLSAYRDAQQRKDQLQEILNKNQELNASEISLVFGDDAALAKRYDQMGVEDKKKLLLDTVLENIKKKDTAIEELSQQIQPQYAKLLVTKSGMLKREQQQAQQNIEKKKFIKLENKGTGQNTKLQKAHVEKSSMLDKTEHKEQQNILTKTQLKEVPKHYNYKEQGQNLFEVEKKKILDNNTLTVVVKNQKIADLQKEITNSFNSAANKVFNNIVDNMNTTLKIEDKRVLQTFDLSDSNLNNTNIDEKSRQDLAKTKEEVFKCFNNLLLRFNHNSILVKDSVLEAEMSGIAKDLMTIYYYNSFNDRGIFNSENDLTLEYRKYMGNTNTYKQQLNDAINKQLLKTELKSTKEKLEEEIAKIQKLEKENAELKASNLNNSKLKELEKENAELKEYLKNATHSSTNTSYDISSNVVVNNNNNYFNTNISVSDGVERTISNIVKFSRLKKNVASYKDEYISLTDVLTSEICSEELANAIEESDSYYLEQLFEEKISELEDNNTNISSVQQEVLAKRIIVQELQEKDKTIEGLKEKLDKEEELEKVAKIFVEKQKPVEKVSSGNVNSDDDNLNENIIAQDMITELPSFAHHNNNVEDRLDMLDFNQFATAAAAGDEDESLIKKGVWASGLYGVGKQEKIDSRTPYSSSTKGLSLGFDMSFNDNLLGIAYSYVNAKVKYQNKHNNEYNINSNIFSIYGKKPLTSKLCFQAITSLAFNKVTGENFRKMKVDEKLDVNNKSFNYSLLGKLNYNINVAKDFLFVPYVGLKYGDNLISEYKETGEGMIKSIILSNNPVANVAGIVGVNIMKNNINFHGFNIIPKIHASCEYNFNHSKIHQLNATIDIAGKSKEFKIATNKQSPFIFNIGAGLNIVKKENLETSVNYNYSFDNQKYSAHQGNLKVHVKF